MARGNQSSLVLGLSALFYLALLFLPLSFIQTASAEQDPLQESYGTGETPLYFTNSPIVGAVTDMGIANSYWYRFGYNLLLRRCDAEGKSRDSSQ
jgi:hypothetical protein